MIIEIRITVKTNEEKLVYEPEPMKIRDEVDVLKSLPWAQLIQEKMNAIARHLTDGK